MAEVTPRATWALAIGTVIVAVVGSVTTAYFTSKNAARTSEAEIVRLAVRIAETPTSSTGMKTWAFDTIAQYANVSIDGQTRSRLIMAISEYPNLLLLKKTKQNVIADSFSPRSQADLEFYAKVKELAEAISDLE